MLKAAILFLLPCLCARTTSAQPLAGGHVTLMLDHLPHAREAVELRARIFAERTIDVGDRFTFHLSGHVDGLLADRERSRRDAIARPLELYADARFARGDIRAGFGRLVWGRLDELQPSDVVNPLDVSRFLFESRSEARLPVALVRARLFLPRESTLEAVVVPVFRRGRFDQLDEPRSPFNLVEDATPAAATRRLPIVRREPEVAWRNLQGGARFSTTTRRIDWAVAAYRGFETFPLYALPIPQRPSASGPIGQPIAAVAALHETFPRITMLAADFETARGPWGLRGELAAFIDDNFQATDAARIIGGRSFQAGIGADRRAGDYRVAANLLVERSAPDDMRTRTNSSLIGAAERSFSRETRVLKAFAVYNVTDAAIFVRTIGALSLRDNVWLEGSVGWFFGNGHGVLSRFSDRDFVYGRLKAYF